MISRLICSISNLKTNIRVSLCYRTFTKIREYYFEESLFEHFRIVTPDIGDPLFKTATQIDGDSLLFNKYLI